ncbi:hypothetical protein Aduo_002271 [Ancylostoma duodenale]
MRDGRASTRPRRGAKGCRNVYDEGEEVSQPPPYDSTPSTITNNPRPSRRLLLDESRGTICIVRKPVWDIAYKDTER